MSWFRRGRVKEATPQQVAATGASGWSDGEEFGYRRAGGVSSRAVPEWTRERAVTHSVASYRSNPMGRAIIDTYVAFCVGDSGVILDVADPKVREVAEAFWMDPAVDLANRQELALRTHMLNGESCYEAMVGPSSGVMRIAPIDPCRVCDVELRGGNAWWPEAVMLRQGGGKPDVRKTVVGHDDLTGLLSGEVLWWPSWQALETDTRGFPFLGPVLDWLGSYDQVISNLVDRTALARYMVWDVTIDGADQDDIDEWKRLRGGLHAPGSGSVEVHNERTTWESKSAQTGAYEDANAAGSVLTLVAGGAGLSKAWLADPDDSNRATAASMAEPIRRRVASVQGMWLKRQTQMVRLAVDRAVAAGRLAPTVQVSRDGVLVEVPASSTVTVRGPQVAAADAQIAARVLVQASAGLETMVRNGLLSKEAGRIAARKAWEDFAGVPWRPELGDADANPDDVAELLDMDRIRSLLQEVG